MKIVVNKCYGGFGLSRLATKEYLKLIGKECYFYEQDGFGSDSVFTRLPDDKSSMVTFAFTNDYGDAVKESDIDWDNHYFNDYDIARDDKNLVSVIEKLGSELASDSCAKLKVIEIPNGTDWQISEYDGLESIEEKHRSW